MEHQEDVGHGGAAKSNPAAAPRNCEIALTGDYSGMGHCDSPAQLCGDGGVFGAGEGTITINSERSSSALAGSQVRARATSEGRGSVSSYGSAPKFSLASATLLTIFRVYQVFLSPFLGGACKFYPSCSNYAYQAVERHGARRGFVMALKRLARCRPFTKGGVDLVPERDESHALSRTRNGLLSVPVHAPYGRTSAYVRIEKELKQ